MKKIILLIVTTLLLTGCVKVDNQSYDEIINNTITSNKISLNNQSYHGYKYYLPRQVVVSDINENNILLKTDKYKMYMYVDLISYYNKIRENYQVSSNAYYSKQIINDDKFGYLEINKTKDDKYLVEIMYNYAKIEVIVDECDTKLVTSYAIAILNSISYNDSIIENMIGENVLNYNEVEFNIFETVNNESNLIQYDENSSESENDEELDTDLVG